MKIRTSYFYQIRNFKPNMIPVSTALGDPIWFHAGDKASTYWDKRGILNGLRYPYLMAQGNCYNTCPCKNKDYTNCLFLKEYEQELDTLDIERIKLDLETLIRKYSFRTGIKEEDIIIVFIVHEAWYNKCSERQGLQNFFNKHGIECKELEYPI